MRNPSFRDADFDRHFGFPVRKTDTQDVPEGWRGFALAHLHSNAHARASESTCSKASGGDLFRLLRATFGV